MKNAKANINFRKKKLQIDVTGIWLVILKLYNKMNVWMTFLLLVICKFVKSI